MRFMQEGRTVFAQVMDWLPKYDLAKCVARYRGDFHVRSMPCYEQFLIMGFAQLTYRESLRDIETCLRALGPKLYHSGIRSRPARSTLAVCTGSAHVYFWSPDGAACVRVPVDGAVR